MSGGKTSKEWAKETAKEVARELGVVEHGLGRQGGRNSFLRPGEGGAKNDAAKALKARAADAAERVRASGARVVAFDMDFTAVCQHSMGRLKRGKTLEAYVDHASPDFVALVPELVARGLGVAIATHSDSAEFQGLIKRETHILGCELAGEVLRKHFPALAASKPAGGLAEPDPHALDDEDEAQLQVGSFLVIGYNPTARRGGRVLEHNGHKRYHMRALARHFGAESPEQVLFFDDVGEIVADCRLLGVRAQQVDPQHAFRLADLDALLAKREALEKLLTQELQS